MAEANRSITGKAKTKGFHGKMPVKRSINLAAVHVKKISVPKAIIGIGLIIVLAGLFGKFGVADRLAAISKAYERANAKSQELARLKETLQDYEGIEEAYAHYTYADMTQEEMGLVSRTEVLALIGEVFSDEAEAFTWSVSGNVLTIELRRDSLEELNDLAKKLEESSYVDTCTLTTANKKVKSGTGLKVIGTFTVYLQQPPVTGTEDTP